MDIKQGRNFIYDQVLMKKITLILIFLFASLKLAVGQLIEFKGNVVSSENEIPLSNVVSCEK